MRGKSKTFKRSRLLTIALPIILFIAGISVTCSGSAQTPHAKRVVTTWLHT